MYLRNLNSLLENNKSLAERVARVSLEKAEETISVGKTPDGEYVLLRNNLPIDNPKTPIQSIKELYDETIKKDLNKYDFIIIFGLGIGHLLDYTYNKSFSRIILYEPDLSALRFTMEYIDLRKYLDDNRVFITDNLTECANYITEKYLIEDKIEFLYLKNYVLQKPSEFNILTERIYQACQQKIIDMNTIKRNSKIWSNNIINSLSYPNPTYPLNIIENAFEGRNALILGAGPSLKDNLELIKANRNKFIIFAVGRTLETLRVKGIDPDFTIFVDAQWMQPTTTKDTLYLKNLNFILDIKADNYAYIVAPKRIFTYYPLNSIFAEKLKEKAPNEIKLYQTAGTATFCAYNCARILGCKNIIFAGLDLAFKDDVVYCDNMIAVANTQNSVKIQDVERKITTIKSVTGKMISTREDYASFVKHFEKLIVNDRISRLYNISDFGAYIQGMEYKPLKEILESLPIKNEITLEEDLKHKINKSCFSPKTLKKKSLDVIKEEKEKLDKLIEKINEWFEMYQNHLLYFDTASKIIIQIPSNSLLSDYLQIELLKFTKMVFEPSDEIKRKFFTDLFIGIKNFRKNLDNLI